MDEAEGETAPFRRKGRRKQDCTRTPALVVVAATTPAVDCEGRAALAAEAATGVASTFVLVTDLPLQSILSQLMPSMTSAATLFWEGDCFKNVPVVSCFT